MLKPSVAPPVTLLAELSPPSTHDSECCYQLFILFLVYSNFQGFVAGRRQVGARAPSRPPLTVDAELSGVQKRFAGTKAIPATPSPRPPAPAPGPGPARAGAGV